MFQALAEKNAHIIKVLKNLSVIGILEGYRKFSLYFYRYTSSVAVMPTFVFLGSTTKQAKTSSLQKVLPEIYNSILQLNFNGKPLCLNHIRRRFCLLVYKYAP